MGEAAQSCSAVICARGVHLPAVTGDVIRWEDGVGLHLCGTVLLGDVVIQGKVMSRGTDRGSTWESRSRPGSMFSLRPSRGFSRAGPSSLHSQPWI